MECGRELNNPLELARVLAASIGGRNTRQAASQRDTGAKAAETGESVTRRKEQEARGMGQSAELTRHRITLRAMQSGVKHYNAGLDSSMIQARCDARSEGQSGYSLEKR
jgi:hypothetical protein